MYVVLRCFWKKVNLNAEHDHTVDKYIYADIMYVNTTEFRACVLNKLLVLLDIEVIFPGNFIMVLLLR